MTHPMKRKMEAARFWRDHLRDRCRRTPTTTSARRGLVAEIQLAVATYYSVPKNDLLIKTREPHIVRPRQIAMFLARRFTRRSFPWIGERFGGMDHTTVLHSVNRIAELSLHDVELRDDLEELSRRIVRDL